MANIFVQALPPSGVNLTLSCFLLNFTQIDFHPIGLFRFSLRFVCGQMTGFSFGIGLLAKLNRASRGNLLAAKRPKKVTHFSGEHQLFIYTGKMSIIFSR